MYNREDEKLEKVKVKRAEAILRWRERNPDTILNEPVFICRAWPAGLLKELDAAD